MGGRGSGGRNRVSADEHLRRGTFRPDRHAGIGKLLALPLPVDAPPTPQDLAEAGGELWRLLWTCAPWLTALDSEMVRDACNAADDLALARRRYQATTDPSDARAVESAARTKARALMALGIGPRDRAALGLVKIEASTKLDALRRRARQTEQRR